MKTMEMNDWNDETSDSLRQAKKRVKHARTERASLFPASFLSDAEEQQRTV
jgi:hypothetical protein